MKRKFNLYFYQILIIILISVGIGYGAGRYQVSARLDGFKPILEVKNQNLPNAQNLDMTLFYTVLNEINEKYYNKEKIDSTKILYGAISGMLSSLDDPYTAFFPPKENESFKTQLAGEFSGIGAELSLNDQKQIVVVSPLDGSPAKAAGIRAGDLILKVDGSSTSGWDLPKAVENIRGEKGTTVTLSIIHEGSEDIQDIKITRDTIEIESVTGWFRSFNCSRSTCSEKLNCAACIDVAYIRISQFGEKTNEEWLKKVNELMPQINTSKNFKGLVLDVRSNPGGILDDAVYIASEFIESGETVVIQEDGNGKRLPLTAQRTGVMRDIPLLVLTNKGSASASEILAGALRDHGRAKLLGEKSFGKGTIQQPVDVDGGGSIHVSIAKWLTPNGIWVNTKEGLDPDILVEYDASASATLEEDKLDNQIIRAVQELNK